MNHLAHARLAGPATIDIAANLMGDFVRGRLEERYAPGVEAGLRLHRAIDTYTDSHPVHRRSRERLESPFRRYGGILVDMYYDHFLARHFEDYSDQSLTDFTDRVYGALEQHKDELPERLRILSRLWRREDLLAGYGRMAVMGRAFEGLSQRLSRNNPLDQGLEPLRANYGAFEGDFRALFPDLLDFAGKERRRIRQALELHPDA